LSNWLTNGRSGRHEEGMPFDGTYELIRVGCGIGTRIIEGCDARINEMGEYICNDLVDPLLGRFISSLQAFLEARKSKYWAVGKIGID